MSEVGACTGVGMMGAAGMSTSASVEGKMLPRRDFSHHLLSGGQWWSVQPESKGLYEAGN